MGRQVLFHMLEEDCGRLIESVRRRDPVVVVDKNGDSAFVAPTAAPCRPGQVLCLWNRRLLSALQRTYIPQSSDGPYFRVSDSLPVIELFLPRQDHGTESRL